MTLQQNNKNNQNNEQTRRTAGVDAVAAVIVNLCVRAATGTAKATERAALAALSAALGTDLAKNPCPTPQEIANVIDRVPDGYVSVMALLREFFSNVWEGPHE